jgi:UDP-3-O-[3-hydroxymyristoyl] glucosamine N-acyltransferase
MRKRLESMARRWRIHRRAVLACQRLARLDSAIVETVGADAVVPPRGSRLRLWRARLRPRVRIGAGVRLGHGVTLRAERGARLVVGDGAAIGDGARIKRSLLLPGAEVPPGCYLVEAIAGRSGSLIASSNLDQ